MTDCIASDDRNIQQLLKAALIQTTTFHLIKLQSILHIFFFFFFLSRVILEDTKVAYSILSGYTTVWRDSFDVLLGIAGKLLNPCTFIRGNSN